MYDPRVFWADSVLAEPAHVVAGERLRYYLFVRLGVEVADDLLQSVIHAAETDVAVGQCDIVIKSLVAVASHRIIAVVH